MRSAIVPAYVLLCIVLGGSVQGVWGVAALQLMAIAIIGWSLLAKDRYHLSGAAKAVDFPLRTAALSAIMAACLALMARPRPRESAESEELWPTTRHLAV